MRITIPPCPRCGTPIEMALIRHLEEGGPCQCPRCTWDVNEGRWKHWMKINGRTVETDETGIPLEQQA